MRRSRIAACALPVALPAVVTVTGDRRFVLDAVKPMAIVRPSAQKPTNGHRPPSAQKPTAAVSAATAGPIPEDPDSSPEPALNVSRF